MSITVRILINVIVLILANAVDAQTRIIKLDFQPAYGSETFDLVDSTYIPQDGSDISIETLKFYISNIRLLKSGELVFEEQNSVHLIDASKIETLEMSLPMPEAIDFDALQFDLGIDSMLNVSGAKGGDLDPTNGMYWTWQNGYINFKLEGKSEYSPARNNEFQFHLGGYQSPFNNLKKISQSVSNTDTLIFILDVENILNEIDLSKMNHVMSPGENALLLSSIVSASFSLRKE